MSPLPVSGVGQIDEIAVNHATGEFVFASSSDLFKVPGVGGAATPLTSGSFLDHAPAVSPNGTKIAFERNTSGNPYQIHIMNSDGSGEMALTSTPATYNFHPAFCDDGAGTTILIYEQTSTSNLRRISITGTQLADFVTPLNFESQPAGPGSP
jgi:Tol biopolymer transport system component